MSIYTLVRWVGDGVLCIYGWERSNAHHFPTTSQAVTRPLAPNPILCFNTTMIKRTTTMNDFPTDAELKQLDAEVDDTLSQDCDDWVDSMMMGIIEDIQY